MPPSGARAEPAMNPSPLAWAALSGEHQAPRRRPLQVAALPLPRLCQRAHGVRKYQLLLQPGPAPPGGRAGRVVRLLLQPRIRAQCHRAGGDGGGQRVLAALAGGWALFTHEPYPPYLPRPIPQSDFWRVLYVLKHTSNAKHPFHKFGIGNRRTLWEQQLEQGRDPRDEARSFFKKCVRLQPARLRLPHPLIPCSAGGTLATSCASCCSASTRSTAWSTGRGSTSRPFPTDTSRRRPTRTVHGRPPSEPQSSTPSSTPCARARGGASCTCTGCCRHSTRRCAGGGGCPSRQQLLNPGLRPPFGVGAQYESKSLDVIVSLLGHEAEGSLLELLKRQGLANALSASSAYETRYARVCAP